MNQDWWVVSGGTPRHNNVFMKFPALFKLGGTSYQGVKIDQNLVKKAKIFAAPSARRLKVLGPGGVINGKWWFSKTLLNTNPVYYGRTVSQTVSGSFPVYFEKVGVIKQCFSRSNPMYKRSSFASGESWRGKVLVFGSSNRTQVV